MTARQEEILAQRKSERMMSVYCALYAYANDYGMGERSYSYRLLCTVTRPGKFNPAPGGIAYESLDPEGQDLYDRLVRRGY
jgi:hypothetical protein